MDANNVDWFRVGANAMVTFGTVGSAIYAMGLNRFDVAVMAALFQAIIVLGQEVNRECNEPRKGAVALSFFTLF